MNRSYYDRTLRKTNTYRIWGDCDRRCIQVSRIYLIQTCATHYVWLRFRHWVIYVTTICPWHGIQRWCIEKISLHYADLFDGPKVVQNKSIYMSCSTYSKYLELKDMKFTLTNQYYLDQVYYNILTWNKNAYNVFVDNCMHFKHRFWKWLSQMY